MRWLLWTLSSLLCRPATADYVYYGSSDLSLAANLSENSTFSAVDVDLTLEATEMNQPPWYEARLLDFGTKLYTLLSTTAPDAPGQHFLIVYRDVTTSQESNATYTEVGLRVALLNLGMDPSELNPHIKHVGPALTSVTLEYMSDALGETVVNQPVISDPQVYTTLNVNWNPSWDPDPPPSPPQSPVTFPPAPPHPPPPPPAGTCTDSCNFPNDGSCDDGGPGAEFTLCSFGTDCNDCGDRMSPSPPPPSPSPPTVESLSPSPISPPPLPPWRPYESDSSLYAEKHHGQPLYEVTTFRNFSFSFRFRWAENQFAKENLEYTYSYTYNGVTACGSWLCGRDKRVEIIRVGTWTYGSYRPRYPHVALINEGYALYPNAKLLCTLSDPNEQYANGVTEVRSQTTIRDWQWYNILLQANGTHLNLWVNEVHEGTSVLASDPPEGEVHNITIEPDVIGFTPVKANISYVSYTPFITPGVALIHTHMREIPPAPPSPPPPPPPLPPGPPLPPFSPPLLPPSPPPPFPPVPPGLQYISEIEFGVLMCQHPLKFDLTFESNTRDNLQRDGFIMYATVDTFSVGEYNRKTFSTRVLNASKEAASIQIMDDSQIINVSKMIPRATPGRNLVKAKKAAARAQQPALIVRGKVTYTSPMAGHEADLRSLFDKSLDVLGYPVRAYYTLPAAVQMMPTPAPPPPDSTRGTRDTEDIWLVIVVVVSVVASVAVLISLGWCYVRIRRNSRVTSNTPNTPNTSPAGVASLPGVYYQKIM